VDIFLVTSYIFTLHLCMWSGGGSSGTVNGRSPDASFGFYRREAFQSQINTEKILYNKSR